MKKLLLFFAAAVCAAAGWANDVVTAKYNGKSLDVELTNTTTFVAFQMDIDLPEGIKVEGQIQSNLDRLKQGDNVSINNVSTATPFVIASNVIDEEKNILRVIAYNLGNHEIKGAEGKLFTINFDNAVTEATISNILFVNQDLVEQELANATAEAGSVFGDVNKDGKITALDLSAMVSIMMGTLTGEEDYNQSAADVNGDTKITALDLSAMVEIMMGKK